MARKIERGGGEAGESGGDYFARIAAGARVESGELIEPQPIPVPKRFWPRTSDSKARFRPPRDIENEQDFVRALNRLRRERARFFRDFAPPALSRRSKVVRFTQADWRLEAPEDRADIRRVFERAGDWAAISLPHYGGPIGRAAAWYRMEWNQPAMPAAGRVLILRFGAVDYRATVYVNGVCVGAHEGFFAPFEFDITAVAHAGRNILAVRVENDAICQGNQSWDQPIDGDKLYAATGLGWDDPDLGWHHCPPGMGITGPVTIEERPDLYIADLWVRPLPEQRRIEVRFEVMNTRFAKRKASGAVTVHGLNFHAKGPGTVRDLPEAGPGLNYYVVSLDLPRFRWWHPDHPWLYRADVIVRDAEGVEDAESRSFGMRSFRQDTSKEPRGRFYLNGQSIRLRGANTMGHEQQCVFKGDLDQLRDDFLIAKLANLNFLRLTQRPVEREIYDMADRVGLLIQCDLPLFAYLRRNQFAEAVRQCAEMERHVRGHPSVVLDSLINEPFPLAWGDKRHRHLDRDELRRFFVAAEQQILVCNPDRVIMPVDGDYDPPSPGLPNFHHYGLWYVGHGIDIGRLHRGYSQKVKPGWLYSCGEYGAEGLDPVDLMRRRYPPSWLPQSAEEEAEWTPDRIVKAQTGQMSFAWFDRPKRLEEWVQVSQAFQREAVRFQSEAFRRDPRLIGSVIHLLIDAFPSGWMKTVVDCERRPKPAYFALRRAMAPLLPLLRSDRRAWFGGETMAVEVWLANDTHDTFPGARLAVQLERGDDIVYAAERSADVRADDAVPQGVVTFRVPSVSERETWTARVALKDARGRVLAHNDWTFEVFPRPSPIGLPAFVLADEQNGTALQVAEALGLRVLPRGRVADAQVLLLDRPPRTAAERKLAEQAVQRGAVAVCLEWPEGEHPLGDAPFTVEKVGMGEGFYFVSRASGHVLVDGYRPRDFWMWTDERSGMLAPLIYRVASGDGWSPILLTGNGGWGRKWEPRWAAAERRFGSGVLRAVMIRLRDRLKVNPIALDFAARLCRLA